VENGHLTVALAALERVQVDVAGIKAQLGGEMTVSGGRATQALAAVENLQADIAGIKTQVGGGGDSVTAWIYAAIGGSNVITAAIYPLLIRPLRKRRESHTRIRPDHPP